MVMLTNDGSGVGDASQPAMTDEAPPVGDTSHDVGIASPAVSDAGTATVAALADDLEYTLTAGQALGRFAAAHRKVPSLRTMQRYCIEGRVAAQKIRTTYGSEWLINEASLARLIAAEPIMAAVAGDADAGDMATTATPVVHPPLFVAADTTANGGAGDAGDDIMAPPAGERRRLSDVLIENAKLLAEVEGRDAMIAEMKEDRNFLREEVREARKTRDDVKNISERMLDTLKTMAIGRLAASVPPTDPIRAEVIAPDTRPY